MTSQDYGQQWSRAWGRVGRTAGHVKVRISSIGVKSPFYQAEKGCPSLISFPSDIQQAAGYREDSCCLLGRPLEERRRGMTLVARNPRPLPPHLACSKEAWKTPSGSFPAAGVWGGLAIPYTDVRESAERVPRRRRLGLLFVLCLRNFPSEVSWGR